MRPVVRAVASRLVQPRLAPAIVATRRLHAVAPRRADDHAAETPAEGGKNKLLFRFTTPAATFFDQVEVDLVTAPAVSGEMGILPNHVPTVAQLKPGVVQVERKGAEAGTSHYFVSGGFCIIKVAGQRAAVAFCDAGVVCARLLHRGSRAFLSQLATGGLVVVDHSR